MTAWTDLVQKIYKEKSGKNSSYKLKHAMKDAAKVYKKHSKTAKKGKKVRRGGEGEEDLTKKPTQKTCEDGSTIPINEECHEEKTNVANEPATKTYKNNSKIPINTEYHEDKKKRSRRTN